MPGKIAALVAALVITASPVLADEFVQVREQSEFVDLISGKHLTRIGIKLAVSPEGRIKGSAFGMAVTGSWQWNEGYFCRDLSYGSEELATNCQAVMVNGDTVRFISDQGAGEYADLRLR